MMSKTAIKFHDYLGKLELPLKSIPVIPGSSGVRNQYSKKAPTLKMAKNSRVMGESLLSKMEKKV